MNNIIKLSLFIFCQLLSFNAFSGLSINIHKGCTGINSAGDHMCREGARSYAGVDVYKKFLDFLCNLSYSDNPSSEQLRESERFNMVERFGAFTALASLQATGSSGSVVPLMPGATVSPFEPADTGTVTAEGGRLVTLDEHIPFLGGGHSPFGDLFDLLDDEGKVGPEACRRLREDFIAFNANAYNQLERKKRLAFDEEEKDMVEVFTELFKFFLENLEYADFEDTVISAG